MIKKEIKTIITSIFAIGISTSGIIAISNESVDKPNKQSQQMPAAYVKESDDPTPTYSSSKPINTFSPRPLAVAPDTKDISKDTIVHMMLNSIDYYDRVSGTMYFASDRKDVVNTIEFQTILSQSESYSKFSQRIFDCNQNITMTNFKETEFQEITYCDKNRKTQINPKEKTYKIYDSGAVFSLDDARPINDNERILTAEDGMPIYRYRSDPTNVTMSSMSLFPQEIAMGFLKDQDLWNIEGVENYNGLKCYKVQGRTSLAYGSKLNVITFEFLIDSKTGVLVKYEGYDENGSLTDFMYTENLKFGDSADNVELFSDNLINEYSEIK